MTIDDPALHERPFTETHDRILHALVEQVHQLSSRVAALEGQDIDVRDQIDTGPTTATAADTHAVNVVEDAPSPPQSRRPAGWQPTRR